MPVVGPAEVGWSERAVVCNPAELSVHERRELSQSLLVASRPLDQEFRDFVARRHWSPLGCLPFGRSAVLSPVPVQNHLTVAARLRKCFPQLLHDPFGTGMFLNVAVQNLAPLVLDHDSQGYSAVLGAGPLAETPETERESAPSLVLLDKGKNAIWHAS